MECLHSNERWVVILLALFVAGGKSSERFQEKKKQIFLSILLFHCKTFTLRTHVISIKTTFGNHPFYINTQIFFIPFFSCNKQWILNCILCVTLSKKNQHINFFFSHLILISASFKQGLTLCILAGVLWNAWWLMVDAFLFSLLPIPVFLLKRSEQYSFTMQQHAQKDLAYFWSAFIGISAVAFPLMMLRNEIVR